MTRGEWLRSMIEEYRRKIGTYETMIREWESELGTQGSPAAVPLGDKAKQQELNTDDPVARVREYQFFGKSQPEAAKLFLEIIGHPLRTATIIEGIERGGLKVGGKTPKDKKTNLYTILHRGDDFGRAGKDAWGLRSWPGIKKESDSKEGNDNGETSEKA